MSSGNNSLRIDADLSALDALFDQLGDQLEASVRPAAQAGAQVLYDQVTQNVAALGTKTGNLAQSIYQAFSPENSGNGKAEYHVSWNARKAPHAHLIEYGHIQKFKVYMGKDGKWYTNKRAPLNAPKQIAAHPFIRPAMSKFNDAFAAAEAVILQRINAGTP